MMEQSGIHHLPNTNIDFKISYDSDKCMLFFLIQSEMVHDVKQDEDLS